MSVRMRSYTTILLQHNSHRRLLHPNDLIVLHKVGPKAHPVEFQNRSPMFGFRRDFLIRILSYNSDIEQGEIFFHLAVVV